MFPYSYYAPNNIYYTPRRVERADPAEDPYWSLERVAALRAAELERKEQQKAELKQQYEQRLAQIDEHHRQQELELKRYEDHIKKLQEQKRLQEQRLLEQQKQKAEARKRNEELINNLFNRYESRQKPADSETSARAESKVPSSPFELLLSLLNGTDLNGSPAETSTEESTPQSATSNVFKNEKKPVDEGPEKTARVVKPEPALDSSTSTSVVSKDTPVHEPTEATSSEAEKESEVNLKESLQSIGEKIDKNIETYDRIYTHTIDGNQEDGEVCSSLSTASDSQPSSITLRSRLKVLQRSQLELENIYQQLDNLGTPKDKIEKRLKHVLTGRAVSYADKVEELRHRIQKDLATVQKVEEHKAAESTPASVQEPVDEIEPAPTEEKPITTAITEPTKAEESKFTPVDSEEEIKKSPKSAPKPEQKEKSRVRRIEIQDLSDDEDL
ncbi:hypothetical protein D0Z00_000015 [Geotrichum galactomycetum]|uniref:Uncharacterized protein n=1 Tax=Geotrichum galactomycetum TaxID=27317 RepID=A0ACB6VBG5_9ASCO|nr:hypothetical protein D0Z00_000015 [Geotrichum candidum]